MGDPGNGWDVRFDLVLRVIEDQVENKAKHKDNKHMTVMIRLT